MSSNFDLRAAVAKVLDTSDLAEPDEIASKVAENVAARDLRSALALALVPYVRIQMDNSRRSNVILNGDSDVQRKQSARSPKVAAIRDAWAAALRDRVHVSDGWKLLGDCTYEDLLFAAEERREKARQNVARAERFEWLAERLQANGVARVADLPKNDLRELEAAA
jgi:hypothetical protein